MRKVFLEKEALRLEGVVDVSLQDGSPEFQVWYFLQGACPGLQFYDYYYIMPVSIIRQTIEYVSDHINKGYGSVLEVMMTKAALRAQGVKI